MNLAAIILSAGLSSRMRDCKPLLPLGDGTLLSCCIELFQANGIEQVTVVTGNRNTEVTKAVIRAGGSPVFNADFKSGMYSSVLAGVESLNDTVDAFFILPVDIPLVRRETVASMIADYERSQPLVLYPRFNGERGHPPLIDVSLLDDIQNHDGSGGLRAVLEANESEACDRDVADFGTVHDLDYPSDYELALSRFDAGVPDDVECRQLWVIYDTPPNNIAHCKAVAAVAEALCQRLNDRASVKLNLPVVRSAALTHDIGKGEGQHEVVGEQRLREHGFPVAATIARDHFDLTLPPSEPISEREIVFLADKLVRGTTPVPLKQRFLEKIELFGHEPGARDAILGRLERANNLLVRFDRELGISCEQLARDVLA